jgi:hypothetical protein
MTNDPPIPSPDAAHSALPPACYQPELAWRIALIARSFERLLGRPLIHTGTDPVAALWSAPLAVVAHATQDDPVFFFGNAAALAAFECDFSRFTAMPSRLSAQAPDRAERQRLLERVARDNFIEDYAGTRISASGRTFVISGATVWNLVDAEGRHHGQAAAFTP